MTMEFMGISQQLIALLAHAPSGKPKFLTSAIRRSLVVAYMGARGIGIRYISPVAALIGWVTLAVTLARGVLQAHGLSEESIGRTPWLILEVVYALGLIAALNPLWRRLRMII